MSSMRSWFSPYHGNSERHRFPLSGIPLSEVFDATSEGNVRRPRLVLVTNLAFKIVKIMLLCMLSHRTSLIGKGKRSTNITETIRFVQATPMHGCRREMKMRVSTNDKFFNEHSSSSFGCSHSGVATADVCQTSAQKIWQCSTPDALPDATYY